MLEHSYGGVMSRPSNSATNVTFLPPNPEKKKKNRVPHGVVPLGTYDGQATPFEIFLSRFESWAVFNDWSEEEKHFVLRGSLTGHAADVFCEPQSKTTTDDLLGLLRHRFGTSQKEERFEMELKSRRKRKGETQQSLYADIRKLTSLAYPGQAGPLVERTAVNAFKSAQDDPNFRSKLRDKQ